MCCTMLTDWRHRRAPNQAHHDPANHPQQNQYHPPKKPAKAATAPNPPLPTTAASLQQQPPASAPASVSPSSHSVSSSSGSAADDATTRDFPARCQQPRMGTLPHQRSLRRRLGRRRRNRRRSRRISNQEEMHSMIRISRSSRCMFSNTCTRNSPLEGRDHMR